jgi:hypothetical protein
MDEDERDILALLKVPRLPNLGNDSATWKSLTSNQRGLLRFFKLGTLAGVDNAFAGYERTKQGYDRLAEENNERAQKYMVSPEIPSPRPNKQDFEFLRDKLRSAFNDARNEFDGVLPAVEAWAKANPPEKGSDLARFRSSLRENLEGQHTAAILTADVTIQEGSNLITSCASQQRATAGTGRPLNKLEALKKVLAARQKSRHSSLETIRLTPMDEGPSSPLYDTGTLQKRRPLTVGTLASNAGRKKESPTHRPGVKHISSDPQASTSSLNSLGQQSPGFGRRLP